MEHTMNLSPLFRVRQHEGAKFTTIDVISLKEAALRVLLAPCMAVKVELTYLFCDAWRKKFIHRVVPTAEAVEKSEPFPERPSRTEDCSDSSSMRHAKKYEVTIHGICHAESYAIELFWDLIGRFSEIPQPLEFYDDFIEVCEQEANHFSSWASHLESLDCPYGSLPTHDSLWNSAVETSHDILARLAVVNLLHEARGLDTFDLSRQKMANQADTKALQIIERNFLEEIDHVRKGFKWFSRVCEERKLVPVETFRSMIRKYSSNGLKGPFNTVARERASFPKEWYSES